MSKVHPRVLERIQRQLRPGSVIDDVFPGRGYTAVQYTTATGEQIRGQLMKAAISNHLKGNALELVVADGTSLNDALEKVSERYHLFWVKGVDFPDTDQVIKFSDLSGFEGTDSRSNFVNYHLVIPDTSVLWSGSTVVRFFQESVDHVIDDTPLLTCLQDQRLQVALSSKVIDGKGDVFTSNKDKLSLAFARKVILYLKSVNITSLSPNDIGQADILDIVTDGFSGIAVVKPKKGPILFLRYRSTGDDVTIPTPVSKSGK